MNKLSHYLIQYCRQILIEITIVINIRNSKFSQRQFEPLITFIVATGNPTNI